MRLRPWLPVQMMGCQLAGNASVVAFAYWIVTAERTTVLCYHVSSHSSTETSCVGQISSCIAESAGACFLVCLLVRHSVVHSQWLLIVLGSCCCCLTTAAVALLLSRAAAAGTQWPQCGLSSGWVAAVSRRAAAERQWWPAGTQQQAGAIQGGGCGPVISGNKRTDGREVGMKIREMNR